VILGVTCIEVHDSVTTGGVLTEDTLDWFAQDTAGNVWYFGENTTSLSTASSRHRRHLHGPSTAPSAGIIMEAHPAVATSTGRSSSRQRELRRVVGLSDPVTVPYGRSRMPEHTRDDATRAGSPRAQVYAAGVGIVLETDEDTGGGQSWSR